jgi:hypothetical protein
MSKPFKDEVRSGGRTCGFCSTNSHSNCKGAIRNGDLSVFLCPCPCVANKPKRCTECFSSEPGDLGRPWLCDDRSACDARIQARLDASPTYRKIMEFLERNHEPSRTSARKSAACLCCDQATRGGNFLPGHDGKWLVKWFDKVKQNEVSKDQALDEVTKVSEHLAKKLEKKLN